MRETYLRKSKLPERIANAPQLRLGLEMFFEAFFDLSPCRSLGFGAGPIPWTAIRDYAEAHDYDDFQTEALEYFIPRMDSVYLGYVNRPKPT